MPKIPTIYLETTIFNFPFADDAPQYRDDVLKLFKEIQSGKYKPFTSQYVIEELEAATDSLRGERLKLIQKYAVEVIPESEESKSLTLAYIKAGIIPEAYSTDGLHIAAATVKGLDFIVSLNFRHIVKRKTIEETELVNFREGYKKIGIYSPSEVIDYA